MHVNLGLRPALGLFAAGLLLLVPAAWADDGSGHRVEIHQHIECDGDDCGEGEVRKVFINADGEAHAVHGDGYHWMSEGPGNFWMHHGGERGFLGVQLTPLTPELRTHFGVPEDVGVMVSKVVDDSPAARAGVAVGDVITAVNGEAVSSPRGLAEQVGGLEDGTSALLELFRDGRVESVTALVESREMGGPGGMHRRVIKCEGDDANCNFNFEGFDCGDAEDCRVMKNCDGGECSCTVNGEDVECDSLPDFGGLHRD